MSKSMWKRLLAAAMCMALIISLAACAGGTEPAGDASEEAPEVSEDVVAEEPEDVSAEQPGDAVFTSGTYVAEAAGRNGTVKVEVTFSATEITDIKVTDHEETQGIADPAIEKIPAEVLEYQSLNVDAIAGATMTSDAILEAIADCVTQAGGDVDALKAVAKVEKEAGALVEQTADVIVVGGGGAGVAAAYSAAEKGASVIVVEKTAGLGGNTMRSGGYLNAVIPSGQEGKEMTDAEKQQIEDYISMDPHDDDMARWQELLAEDWAAYQESGDADSRLFDSIYLHMIQTYSDGDFVGYPSLIENFVTKAPDTYGWLAEKGLDWKEDSFIIVGALWPRSNMAKDYKSGIGFIEVLTTHAESSNLPIQYDFEVACTEFIVEDGKVVGVTGVGADGTPYSYRANNGVVLASGGFGANVEMRQEYNSVWADLGPTVPTTNSPSITGDGIVMAQDVGANLTGMDKIQLLIADPITGETSTNVGDTTSMYVNKEGLRYVNETERRDVLCAATLEQTDGMMYIISSYQNSRLDENYVNTYGIHVDDLVASGAVFRADTIEELAELIDMDPEVLRKSVDDYNAAIDAGYDELTGRTIFNTTAKIEETGPYYANPRAPAVHHTMGGVEVDVDARVLGADGNPIPGLYAAGEVTGGFHGGNRLGGNAISECLTMGRIAGESAVDGK